MPNEEHIKRLKLGAEAWNRWREENLNVQVDLTNAHLVGADLTDIDLRHSNLKNANLSFSRLFNTDLSHSNLQHAILNNTSLESANLTGANLSYASIIKGNFEMAVLHAANLCNAVLKGADLDWALFGGTIFGDTDLTEAEVTWSKHSGPSFLDVLTLIKSGRLHLNFLRGCGLPDVFIEFLPSLLNEPIKFYSCFISYSSKDEDFAKRLYADLQSKGVRVWFAPRDLRVGDKIRSTIDKSIRVYDKLLLVLSAASVGSQWVEQEVETALTKEREQGREMLFPVRLDDSIMRATGGWPSFIRNTRNIGDFRQWKNHDFYQKAFEGLLHDLKAET
jgi:hypothetical protein